MEKQRPIYIEEALEIIQEIRNIELLAGHVRDPIVRDILAMASYKSEHHIEFYSGDVLEAIRDKITRRCEIFLNFSNEKGTDFYGGRPADFMVELILKHLQLSDEEFLHYLNRAYVVGHGYAQPLRSLPALYHFDRTPGFEDGVSRARLEFLMAKYGINDPENQIEIDKAIAIASQKIPRQRTNLEEEQ